MPNVFISEATLNAIEGLLAVLPPLETFHNLDAFDLALEMDVLVGYELNFSTVPILMVSQACFGQATSTRSW